MNHIKTPREEKLQELCDDWNQKNPIGSMVAFEDIVGAGDTFRGAVVVGAMVVGGHSAVAELDGYHKRVDIQHCRKID